MSSLGVEVVDQDRVAAILREVKRRLPTDSLTRAGDQGYSAF